RRAQEPVNVEVEVELELKASFDTRCIRFRHLRSSPYYVPGGFRGCLATCGDSGGSGGITERRPREGSQECAVSSLERTAVLVFSPSSSVFPTSQVPVTMRSLQLLRTPFLCALLWAFCALGARAEEPGASFSHPGSVGLDKSTVHDQEHIMEHLEGVVNKPEAEMSPQELQLHYFKMHDYDGNNLLDGLELSTAITHVHKEEGNEQTPMNEDELINLIDGVLRDDDKNNDGYIDYAEFAKSLQ
ncbi:hypothetical protein E2I00_008758, partial [Balaenoptera physalus]